MTDGAGGLFDDYIAWDATTKDDFIISEVDRDNDPLTCENGDFTDYGTLPSWFPPLQPTDSTTSDPFPTPTGGDKNKGR